MIELGHCFYILMPTFLSAKLTKYITELQFSKCRKGRKCELDRYIAGWKDR